MHDAKDRALYADLNDNLKQYLSALNSIFQIIQARNKLINNTLNVIGPDIAAKLESVKLSVKADQDALGPEVQANAESAINIVMLVSIISLILGVAMSIIVYRSIRKPIGGEPTEIADIARQVSKGDLTVHFKYKDSATGIYRSVAEMTSNLREVIGGIVDTGNAISDNLQSVSTISNQTSVASNEQREKTEHVATAVNEMTYSIQEVAKLASDSAHAAETARDRAQTGKTSVDNTIASIQHLAGRVDGAVEVIESLAENSSNIGSVVEVIQGISEQTNLLALNAAIEAARAGEHGRGFAVVADEVRGLAKRTRESTSEIQEMINTLQTGTSGAVEVMNQSREEARVTVEKSTETAQSLEEILETITQINDMNLQVAASVEEQAKVADEINNNITVISEAAIETSQGANDTSSAAEVMNRDAVELKRLVGQFKL
ncbi:methyl-accepting chemotaxis protein [Catenovulum sp. SM1970]|uniref:methyl-accepting chemotaxis protein n=1 Tax=Marinifaba aquimaris TaxID=2741323 RepID=UPI0015716616|nr:methyl-accepting chemotaxis protein [Marinifaba aquimaris]NTS78036.1 methyl-accepting chemotaxis protein [Marinifaba aquimaris]